MEKQNTIKKAVSYSGIALHTGARANLTIKPSAENTGISFSRVDVPGKPVVKALATNVIDVRRGTTISSGEATVLTVEHVLSSLHAYKIDNVLVEMDGPEPPIGDGSALPYMEMIKDAGVEEQNAEVHYWTCKEPIIVEHGDTKLVLTPADTFKVTCIVAYGATPLDSQYFSREIDTEMFETGIAKARTFCLYRELEQLIEMGLVKGGSLDNAVVIHDGAIICKEELRFPDELVRHKVLDIIGDIYLVGSRAKAHIIAVKPGHPTNVQLAQQMIIQANS